MDMLSNTSLPFRKLKIEKGVTQKSINQFFGYPMGVSVDQWPRSGNDFQHHIVTIDLSEIKNGFWQDYLSISIFLPTENSSVINDDLTVLLNKEITVVESKELPLEYKPWWDKNEPNKNFYEKGIFFSLEPEFDLLTEDQIKQVNEGVLHIDDMENCEAIYNFLYENSYLGGIPIWNIEDLTPKDEHGPMDFLLVLNGCNSLFEYTPIDDFYLYLFKNCNNQFKWIVQKP